MPRSSNFGWFPLGILNSDVVATTKGQVSGVWRILLRQMFLRPGCNLIKGVGVKNWHGQMKSVTARIKLIIQDEAALRQCFSTKGASGSVPCLFCRNAYRGAADPRSLSGGIAHYKTALPHTFALADDADIWNVVDLLQLRQPTVSAAAFADLQQQYGITHSPAGVLLDAQLRAIVRPIGHSMLDWMHVLCCSGGVFQLLIMAILQTFVSGGITLAELDSFANNVSDTIFEKRLSGQVFTKQICVTGRRAADATTNAPHYVRHKNLLCNVFGTRPLPDK